MNTTKELKEKLITSLLNKEVYKKSLNKLINADEKFRIQWMVDGYSFITFEEDEVKDAMAMSLIKRIQKANKVIVEYSTDNPEILFEIKFIQIETLQI